MKKSILFVLFLLILAACTPKTVHENVSDQDSTEVIDTTVVDTVALDTL